MKSLEGSLYSAVPQRLTGQLQVSRYASRQWPCPTQQNHTRPAMNPHNRPQSPSSFVLSIEQRPAFCALLCILSVMFHNFSRSLRPPLSLRPLAAHAPCRRPTEPLHFSATHSSVMHACCTLRVAVPTFLRPSFGASDAASSARWLELSNFQRCIQLYQPRLHLSCNL